MTKRYACGDCLYYPERSRQAGSDMCVRVDSSRSVDSRPCWPRPRTALAATPKVSWFRRFLDWTPTKRG